MGSMNEFIIQVYFSQIYSGLGKKMYSKSLSLAITLAEINDANKELEDLEFIYNNTTSRINVSLPILEGIIDKQFLRKKNFPKMQRQRINGRLIKNHTIIKALSDAYIEITKIVTKIAKNLNVELEFDASKYPVDK